VVNSHLVCDPTIRQPGFDLPRQWSLLNRFRTEQGHCGACRRKWRLTDTDLLVARPRRCLTLSNPVPWQNWMPAYLGYTLRMRTLFRGWPIMVNDTHTRRRLLYFMWNPYHSLSGENFVEDDKHKQVFSLLQSIATVAIRYRLGRRGLDLPWTTLRPIKMAQY